MSLSPVIDKSFIARVTDHARVGADGHVLTVALPAATPMTILPGQFFMVRDPRPGFPFLSRPFSVLDFERDGDGNVVRLQFLFKVVGKGTGMLAELTPEAPLALVGPLGNSWPASAATVACVAGGVGLPPLYLEIKAALARGVDARRFVLVYGARSRGQLYLHEAIAAFGVRTMLVTEDGSLGRPGRVDAPLRELLAEHRQDPLEIHACGPERMLEVVGHLARESNQRCFLSLETFMGCGFGVCNACAVKVRDAARPQGFKYERCCRDGSIFDHARLLWN